MDQTRLYQASDFQEKLIEETIKEVCDALSDKGYNPVNQLVGYLLSGDPGYISNHRGARSKMTQYERAKVLEVIVKSYLE